MAQSFLNAPPESLALVHNLAACCVELGREKTVRVHDRVISGDDVETHFKTLMECFTRAAAHRAHFPSFSSSIVVAVMAKLIYDRATIFDSRPSQRYQSAREILENELRKAVSDEPGDVGILRLYLRLKHRRIAALERVLDGDKALIFEGLSPSGGPVFHVEGLEILRFATLVQPPPCDAHSVPGQKQRVTLTTMERNGDIAFLAGCSCNYLATGLELEHDL